MKVNFGNVADNYSLYRNDLPADFIPALKIRGYEIKGKKAADLGAGTGVLTRALCEEGADVTGIEPSRELIKKAEEQNKEEGTQIKYKYGCAESTGLRDEHFDYVTVFRAWHWFDRQKALEEIRRISKKNSTLIVADSGFVSKSKVIRDTMDIVGKYKHGGKIIPAGAKAEAGQVINGFPVDWFREWQDAHFDLQEIYKFTYDVLFTNEDWCGRVGSLSWMAEFEGKKQQAILNELYDHLLYTFGETDHKIEHSCFTAVLKRNPDPVDQMY
jgi:ubiquinone/menaquinone biosynthesis C-methylase UbiE